MKAVIVAAAAGLFGSAMAAAGHHKHAAFHQRRGEMYAYPTSYETCGCTTYTTTIYGQPTLAPMAPPSAPSMPPMPPMPTPVVTTCPTPGTYTMPSSTLIVTSTVTAPAATTTILVPGTHTYGGVTTIVETSTTVTCPYATVIPTGETYTTVVTSTTYVCPSAGTYTFGHTTTAVDTTTTVVYPTITSYAPGTYTAPATTLTVTEKSYVYVCPYSTIHPAPAPAAPTKPAEYHPAPAPVAPTKPAEYHPAPAPSAAAYTPAPASKPAPKPAQKPPKHADKPSGGIIASGPVLGITFTPYTESGLCKDAGSVMSDMTEIKAKGIKTVRVYSTDCNALETVGKAAHDLGMNLILGAFIGGGGAADAYPQIEALCKFEYKSIVEMIVIGNEAVFAGHISMSGLVALIKEASGKLKSSGYGCPITTTETLNILQQSGSMLCDVVDVMGANIQPYFNADVSPSNAGDFVAGQLALVEGICPGKEAYNLECGWPNGGPANGKAVTGYDAQKTALESIIAKVGKHTIVFSFKNDNWKTSDANSVEDKWGCFDAL